MVAVLGAFVGASTATGTGGDTVSDSLSVPGGTSDGDIMLLFSHGLHTVIPDGSWKFATSNLVWKIADSEPGSYDLGDADNVATLLVYNPAGSLPAGFPGWNVDDVFWAQQGSDTAASPGSPFSDTESYPLTTDATTLPTLPVGAFQADQCIDIWPIQLTNANGTSGLSAPSWSSLTGDTFRSSLWSDPSSSGTHRWTVQAADNLTGIADASYDVSGLASTVLTVPTRHDGGPFRYIPRWFAPETPPPPRTLGTADGYWGVLLGAGDTPGGSTPATPHFPMLASYSVYQGAQATDHDVPYPTGTVPGDLLVMFLGTSNALITRSAGSTTWDGRSIAAGASEAAVLWASPVVGAEDHINLDFPGASTSRLLAITLRFRPHAGMIFFGTNNPYWIDPEGQLQSGSSPFDGYGEDTDNGVGNFTIAPTKLQLDETFYQDNPPAYDHNIAAAQDLMWMQALVTSDYDSTNGGNLGGDNALPSTPSGWTLLDQVEDVTNATINLRLGVYYRMQNANEVTFPSATVTGDRFAAIGGIAGEVFEQ